MQVSAIWQKEDEEKSYLSMLWIERDLRMFQNCFYNTIKSISSFSFSCIQIQLDIINHPNIYHCFHRERLETTYKKHFNYIRYLSTPKSQSKASGKASQNFPFTSLEHRWTPNYN